MWAIASTVSLARQACANRHATPPYQCCPASFAWDSQSSFEVFALCRNCHLTGRDFGGTALVLWRRRAQASGELIASFASHSVCESIEPPARASSPREYTHARYCRSFLRDLRVRGSRMTAWTWRVLPTNCRRISRVTKHDRNHEHSHPAIASASNCGET